MRELFGRRCITAPPKERSWDKYMQPHIGVACLHGARVRWLQPDPSHLHGTSPKIIFSKHFDTSMSYIYTCFGGHTNITGAKDSWSVVADVSRTSRETSSAEESATILCMVESWVLRQRRGSHAMRDHAMTPCIQWDSYWMPTEFSREKLSTNWSAMFVCTQCHSSVILVVRQLIRRRVNLLAHLCQYLLQSFLLMAILFIG